MVTLFVVAALVSGSPASAQYEAWVARYNGPSNLQDSATALAVDAAGNVYVAGGSAGVGTDFDYATVKYDANGTQLWVARYNGPGNGLDDARALAVDAAGNIYVTGSSLGVGTGFDYATVKYDANGTQLWVARYNGPGFGIESASALAVDATGNVYVTGSSAVTVGNADYATVKYDANGTQLWVARYNGPRNFLDSAFALAVDAAGNAYVTGSSVGVGTGYDYATVKYDANGTQLWVARYNGPGNGLDAASDLAVDAAGNVYVTGYSVGAGTSSDYATVKYTPWNTLPGSDVIVSPVDPNTGTTPVTLTFATVTAAGETTVTSSATGEAPPPGFKLGDPPVYYTVETTAGYSGTIEICVNYAGIGYTNEAKLKLLQYTSGKWQAVTDPGYPDTANKIICGTVTSLSLFGMFEPSFGFAGFLPPLENPPVLNSAGAGRTIPVKWQLVDGSGSYISDLAAVTGIQYQQVSCASWGGDNPIEDTLTSGSSGLRYDPTDNQYVYNWATDKSMAGNCYTLILTLYRFDERRAYVQMK